MSRASRHRSAIVLAAAVSVGSWAAILVRSCDAPSLAVAFWRMALATCLLLPWAPAAIRSARRITLVPACLAGVFLAVHFATWITSLTLTSVASSVLLVSTTPVFTAVLGPFLLRERPGGRSLVAVALSLVGTALLVGGDLALGRASILGDGLALAGALAWSVYLMIGRRIRDHIELPRYLFLVYASATAVLALIALVSGTAWTGFGRLTWFWLFLLAAGPSLAGHGLMNWCVRRMRAITVNVAWLAEPVLATLYALLLFGEVPRPAFYPGALLIGAGILLAALEESSRRGAEGVRG